MNRPELERKSFLLLVAIVSVAFAWIVWPFFGAVFWSTVLATLFAPLYARILASLGRRRSLAALATVLACLVGAIVPLVLLALAVVREGTSLYQAIVAHQSDIGATFQSLSARLPAWMSALLDRLGLGNFAALQETLSSAVLGASKSVATYAIGIGQNAFGLVLDLGIALYVLFFLLRDGAELSARIERAIPLARETTRRLFARLAGAIRATIKGSAVIAVVQGTLGGVALAMLGIEGALLWGAVMAVFSLLPVVGASLVWAPVALYLLLTGAVLKAVALTVFGVVVVGLVDNLLRPILIGKDTRMPDYVVLVSTLGGIALFGFNGFVIGPVVAALFLATWGEFTAAQDASER
ncbi:MAG: AI-2E family transporter [Betaproteobacteria bacterium]